MACYLQSEPAGNGVLGRVHFWFHLPSLNGTLEGI